MPAVKRHGRTVGEGDSHKAHRPVPEESDSGVVPMNHSNKEVKPLAEGEEGRPLIKENTLQLNTSSTQSEIRVSQGLAVCVKQRRKERRRRSRLCSIM